MNHTLKIKAATQHFFRSRRGSAIITVILFSVLAAMVTGSVLMWSSGHGKLVGRQNEFVRAQYVAEAGVEKTFSALLNYLNTYGRAPAQSDITSMASTFIPTSTDFGSFSAYQFVTTSGGTNQIPCTVGSTATYKVIDAGPYTGVYGLVLPYTVTSRVNSKNRPYVLNAGIKRTIEYQAIPIFQFAVFFNSNLEIENGPEMTITGRVHTNQNGYFAPSEDLNFSTNVTVAKQIYYNLIPGDTHKTPPGGGYTNTTHYTVPPTQGANTLNLPPFVNQLGNTPHDILELPPSSGTDSISAERLYNKAGLRIQVFNGGTYTATLGNNSSTTLSSSIISTNKKFWDFREDATITVTEINIGAMMSASKVPTNGVVYVIDRRTNAGEVAIRLVGGTNMPSQGLTIATPNPIYIKGSYNTSGSSEPAAIMADAINILSNNWSDSNSSDSSISDRTATATTINAAFFAGNVPTSGSNYSGGLENFPRFHEDWDDVTFTYKGSMVCMFPSEIATGKWGDASYGAPDRAWTFDTNFLDPTKTPPGTPAVLTLARATWEIVP